MNGLGAYLPTVLDISYLVAGILFIFGVKSLSSPDSAPRGNRMAAIGMLLAVIATLLDRGIIDYTFIFLGILVGAVVGVFVARWVKMTAVPQMVAVFNGFGGGASALVSIVESQRFATAAGASGEGIPIVLGIMIGSLTFSGSMIAFGKLQGLVSPSAVAHPLMKVTFAVLLAGMIGVGIYAYAAISPLAFLILVALALGLGIAMVVPIGGADMPVVISLMNSFSGLAVVATGFVLQNTLLIIGGTLVGASGTLLTHMMSKAMNRSLTNVLFSAFGATITATAGASADGDATVRQISAMDAGVLMAYSRSVIFVPGYGMAVAQAQHEVRELADLLERRGVSVKHAIHPVAGRMPGHMNVLLAEANVPYSQLVEMDVINPEFSRTDVALVIGANDVTNPAARNSPGSPIYGMPILDVDQAAHVIVLKRSMRPGFAGIDNDLYLDPKTSMLFGDAKDSLRELVAEVKAA